MTGTAEPELQRLKPIRLGRIYVVAKATTHKDSRVSLRLWSGILKNDVSLLRAGFGGGFRRCAMMASQRFVQLAQADAAPSSTLFPASNHRPNVSYAHRPAFAGAVDAADSA